MLVAHHLDVSNRCSMCIRRNISTRIEWAPASIRGRPPRSARLKSPEAPASTSDCEYFCCFFLFLIFYHF
ncbi:unnamed protein product [Nippostrongylus brasiliensis]|uniref:Uncharacterized protein n=1 Tax=Nippostrongylus brasiliensis TaxID=27835 RepID=A0A158R315_NIPBR|nr:unnamed protein product [Nippostrongylus brasiliensis]